jgi:hypothetical protein
MCFVWLSEQTVTLPNTTLTEWVLKPKWKVFTPRHGLTPYITQICFFLQELTMNKHGMLYC